MIFLNKDFSKMTSAGLHVHCGLPEVTARTFEDLIGYRYTDLKQVRRLEKILAEITTNGPKAEKYSMLLSVEYGKDICLAQELEADTLNFLKESGPKRIEDAFAEMTATIRALYEE